MLLKEFYDKHDICPICESKNVRSLDWWGKISRTYKSTDGVRFIPNTPIPEKYAESVPEGFEFDKFSKLEYPWMKFHRGRLSSMHRIKSYCRSEHYEAFSWQLTLFANELSLTGDISYSMNIGHIDVDSYGHKDEVVIQDGRRTCNVPKGSIDTMPLKDEKKFKDYVEKLFLLK